MWWNHQLKYLVNLCCHTKASYLIWYTLYKYNIVIAKPIITIYLVSTLSAHCTAHSMYFSYRFLINMQVVRGLPFHFVYYYSFHNSDHIYVYDITLLGCYMSFIHFLCISRFSARVISLVDNTKPLNNNTLHSNEKLKTVRCHIQVDSNSFNRCMEIM